MTDSPRISFKRGDSFKLDITVTDPNSETSLAAFAVLTAQEATLAAALVVLQEAIDADPYVPQDEIDAQAIVDTAITDLATDQATYDTAIIVDITGWTITSSLRWCGSLITDFIITIINASIGTLTITATPIVSALWKEREHKMDIKFVRNAGTTSSETIMIDVERGATNG